MKHIIKSTNHTEILQTKSTCHERDPLIQTFFSSLPISCFSLIAEFQNEKVKFMVFSIFFMSPIPSPGSGYNKTIFCDLFYQVSERHFLTYSGNGAVFTFDRGTTTHENLLMFPQNRISSFIPALDSREEDKIFRQYEKHGPRHYINKYLPSYFCLEQAKDVI